MAVLLYPIAYPGRTLWRARAFGRDFLVTPLPVDPASLNPGYSIYIIEESPYDRSYNPKIAQYPHSSLANYGANVGAELYLITNEDFSSDELGNVKHNGNFEFDGSNVADYLSVMEELTRYRYDASSSVFETLATFYKECPPKSRHMKPEFYRISQSPHHGTVIGYLKFMAPDPIYREHKILINALFTNAVGDAAFAGYNIPSGYHRYDILAGEFDSNRDYDCYPSAIADPNVGIPQDLLYGTICTDRKISIPYGVMPISRLDVLRGECGEVENKFNKVWENECERCYGPPDDYISLGYDTDGMLDWRGIADETVARYLEQFPPEP